MSTNSRLLLYKKISRVSQNGKKFKPSAAATRLHLKLDKNSREFFFTLPLRSKQYDVRDEVLNLSKNDSDQFLENVEVNEKNQKEIHFKLHKENYVKGLLESTSHGITPPEFMWETPNRVLVEFSSPNIAKPFHVGHLRSTMIGNYIANVNNYFKNDVKRINYLGDWGTQFGFVQLGLSLANVTDEALKNDPMRALYNAYVHANKLAENDSTIADQAREIFQKLETGDESNFSEWKSFRKYTIEELERTYNRIGVKFDIYEWESMYNIKKVNSILSDMEKMKLLTMDSENRKVVQLNEKKSIPIIKSDGSSLYITRDVAAAIQRFEKHNFDKMYYVVDNAQTSHFMNLFSVLNAMKLPWADRLVHVKFGKIKGMSTRKGTAIFLQDILDETKNVMKEKQLESPTTKVNLDYDHPSTEILGISAVVVNDLRHKRHQDYDFDWDKALDVKGDTGVSMQYAHCRLVSLEKNSGATIASECIPSLLQEPVAEDLIFCIGRFDEVLLKSYQELEPYILVHYLFTLSHAIGKALQVLKIKGEEEELARQRLLLMHSARKVLNHGMRLLGLTPLSEM
ncbi:probable arginine--tRNA ligase, mitochondrial [Copidosoma floridanum]|uniref:probable arginine--tRNA ligase, mitochondrial n=1 Tax=Copidosoma floridanum TaxID=29053 RepID=UPI0006C97947|nr:probable arginine--tRNA ligase, mitochondrial [Copidosoma floridanum]